MPKFAANLSMLYPELDFLDRFAAAAADGFKAVEFLFPYAYDANVLAAKLKENGLQQVLFNALTRRLGKERTRHGVLA
jgi:hydroxypyruvate isomerase